MIRPILFLFAAMAFQAPGLAAPQKVNNVEIAPGASVALVFYTADNCDWCAKWKAHGKADALQWAGKAKFKYFEIAKPKIAQSYTAAQFPEEAKFAWQALEAEQRFKFMIPRWVIFADGRKVIEGAGLYDWSRVSRFLGDVLEARDAK